MRKILSFIPIISLLASCSNNDSILNETVFEASSVSTVKVVDGKIITDSRASGDVENNALSFKDDKSLAKFKASLSTKNADEKLSLINNYQVQNLHNLVDEADEELELIGEKASSEEEFRSLYTEYVKKYEGLLISNNINNLDLDLYVPDEDNLDTYIANKNGYFVVGNEVKKVNIQPILSDFVIETSLKATANATSADKTHENSYVVNPNNDNKKQVHFSIGRIYNTIRITMQVKKKMWYGWKNDPNRDLIYEPHFSSAQVQWLEPLYTRYWSKSKKKHEVNLLTMTNGATLKGTIYTWTDITAEHDSKGNLLMEIIGNTTTPKCLVKNSTTVIVNLPKTQ